MAVYKYWEFYYNLNILNYKNLHLINGLKE